MMVNVKSDSVVVVDSVGGSCGDDTTWTVLFTSTSGWQRITGRAGLGIGHGQCSRAAALGALCVVKIGYQCSNEKMKMKKKSVQCTCDSTAVKKPNAIYIRDRREVSKEQLQRHQQRSAFRPMIGRNCSRRIERPDWSLTIGISEESSDRVKLVEPVPMEIDVKLASSIWKNKKK
ncbi:hypothetical protein T11_14181 [Trichinella zimbabwensis]|uniref:Uncharacterized protein n=1 Tax=Trichinella zimbabwensis TaxID=268475 RepID=A0A0V1H1Q3_9BILA|nr:hypothetical protein T11_14181 [Trichinella zimbabwensis]